MIPSTMLPGTGSEPVSIISEHAYSPGNPLSFLCLKPTLVRREHHSLSGVREIGHSPSEDASWSGTAPEMYLATSIDSLQVKKMEASEFRLVLILAISVMLKST